MNIALPLIGIACGVLGILLTQKDGASKGAQMFAFAAVVAAEIALLGHAL